MPETGLCQLIHELIDLYLCSDINAGSRLVEEEDFPFAAQGPCEQYFLLVSTAQGFHFGFHTACP